MCDHDPNLQEGYVKLHLPDGKHHELLKTKVIELYPELDELDRATIRHPKNTHIFVDKDWNALPCTHSGKDLSVDNTGSYASATVYPERNIVEKWVHEDLDEQETDTAFKEITYYNYIKFYFDGLFPQLLGYRAPERLLYLERGELITARLNKLDRTEILSKFRGLLARMSQFHELGFIHGDIKPANCVEIDGEWKLIDLGLSRYDPTKVKVEKKYRIQTVAYASPEILSESHDNYGPEIDAFSLGILLIVLLGGKIPLHDLNDDAFTLGEAENMLARMFHTDPSVSLEDIIENNIQDNLKTWIVKQCSPCDKVLRMLVGLLQPNPGKRRTVGWASHHSALSSYPFPIYVAKRRLSYKKLCTFDEVADSVYIPISRMSPSAMCRMINYIHSKADDLGVNALSQVLACVLVTRASNFDKEVTKRAVYWGAALWLAECIVDVPIDTRDEWSEQFWIDKDEFIDKIDHLFSLLDGRILVDIPGWVEFVGELGDRAKTLKGGDEEVLKFVKGLLL